MTDDKDRRLLNLYSSELFREELLDNEIQFGLSELRPDYKVPKCPIADQAQGKSKAADFIKNPNQMV